MKNTIIITVALVLSLSFVLATNVTNETNNSANTNISEVTPTLIATHVGSINVTNLTTIDKQTEKETHLMVSSSLGAKVRMLQLKREIFKSDIIGTKIIQILSEKNINVTELRAILSEIESLKDEITSLDELNYSVENFVSIKKDLIQFNHEFKQIASKKLSSKDKKVLQTFLKDNSELKNLNNQIHTEIKTLNQQRVKNVMSNMGKHNETFLNKIRNGQISPQEIKKKLLLDYKKMNKTNRTVFQKKIKKQISDTKELIQKNKELIKVSGVLREKERLTDIMKFLMKKNKTNAVNRLKKQVNKLIQVQKKLNVNEEEVSIKIRRIKQDIKKLNLNLNNFNRPAPKERPIPRNRSINNSHMRPGLPNKPIPRTIGGGKK